MAFAGLKGLKAVPGLFSAIGFALRRIVTPFSLFISAAVLVTGLFKKLLDESPSLRIAFENIGRTIRRGVVPVFETLYDAFVEIGKIVKALIVPAVEGLAEKFGDFLLPILVNLDTFIRGKVIPTIKDWAEWITDTLVPAIGTALTRGLEIAIGALKEFVKFIQVAFNIFARDDFIGGEGWLAEDSFVVDALFRIREAFEEFFAFLKAGFEIITQGGTTLSAEGWLAYDGPVVKGLFAIRKAFKSLYSYLSETFLPFILNNLAPVLAGLGTVGAVTAVSGGNLPLALAAGVGVSAAVALSDEDIRAAFIETIKGAIESARELLGNLFDTVTSAKVITGALRVANKIGEVLGDIVSDRRLVAAVAAIAGFGVLLAGAFVAGFGEGIIKNIPELTKLLTDGLRKGAIAAVKEVASNPALGAVLIGLFAGGLLLRKLSKAGKASGAILADGMRKGATRNLGATGGNVANQFFKGVFGGPSSIRAAATKSGQVYAKQFGRQITQNRELHQALTGRAIKGLNQTYDPATGRLGGIEENVRNLRLSDRAVGKLTAEYGKGAVAAQQFRLGVKNLGKGLRNIRTDTDQARLGAAQLRTSFQLVGAEIGLVAGVAAGAAFVGAFGAQAAFETGASSVDVVSGVGSAIVAGLGASLVAGGPLTPTGAGVGLAVTGVSLLGGAFLASKANAEAFDQSVKELAASLRDLGTIEFGDTLENAVRQKITEAGTGARQVLIDVGFRIDDFTDELEAGSGVEYVANLFEALGPAGKEFATALTEGEITLGRIDDAIKGDKFFDAIDFVAVQEEIKDAGFEVDDFASAFGHAGETIKFVDKTFTELDLQRQEGDIESLSDAIGGTSLNVQTLDGNIARYAAEADIAAQATKAFDDKLTELNEARLEGLRESVNEAKGLLAEAKTAAEEAKTALADYLNGDYTAEGLATVTNQAALDVGQATRQIAEEIDPEQSGLTPAEIAIQLEENRNEGLQAIRDAARDVLTTGYEEFGDDFDPEVALAPLFAVGAEVGEQFGVDAGTAAYLATQEALNLFNSPGGQAALGEVDTTKADFSLKTWRDERAQRLLDAGVAIDPSSLPGLVLEAQGSAEKVATGVAEGYVNTLAGDETAFAATEDWAKGAIAGATGPAAFDTDSPSKTFETIGGFVVDGFIKGLAEKTEDITGAGVLMMEALALGISETGEYLITLDAGTAAGYAFGDGTAKVGVIASIKDRGLQMIQQVKAGMSESGEYLLLLDAGYNAGLAFARGLARSKSFVSAAAASVAQAAVDAVEDTLKINSPSKVFQDLGSSTMEGFAVGIQDSAHMATDAAAAAMQGAADAAVDVVGGEIAVGTDAAFAGAANQARLNSSGTTTLDSRDISTLATAITTASKPPVTIDQTFNEKVDSRAIATDVAWRLS